MIVVMFQCSAIGFVTPQLRLVEMPSGGWWNEWFGAEFASLPAPLLLRERLMPKPACKEREGLERAVIDAVWGVYALKGADRTAARRRERNAAKALDLHIKQHGCEDQVPAALHASVSS